MTDTVLVHPHCILPLCGETLTDDQSIRSRCQGTWSTQLEKSSLPVRRAVRHRTGRKCYSKRHQQYVFVQSVTLRQFFDRRNRPRPVLCGLAPLYALKSWDFRASPRRRLPWTRREIQRCALTYVLPPQYPARHRLKTLANLDRHPLVSSEISQRGFNRLTHNARLGPGL